MTRPILRDFPDMFETDRLVIRAPRPGDGAELCAAINELRPWLPWAQVAPTPEDSEANVREALARFVLRDDLRLQLYLRDDPGTMVGSSGLHRIDWDAGRFEIGYWLRTRFAGQGLMTEAVGAIARFAFRHLGAHRLEIWCDSRNERSARVAVRVGFVHEATLVDHTRANDGSMASGLCFRMLRPESDDALRETQRAMIAGA